MPPCTVRSQEAQQPQDTLTAHFRPIKRVGRVSGLVGAGIATKCATRQYSASDDTYLQLQTPPRTHSGDNIGGGLMRTIMFAAIRRASSRVARSAVACRGHTLLRRLYIELAIVENGVLELRRDTVEAASAGSIGIGPGARDDRINAVRLAGLALSGEARSNR
jgi:hypothetical protein